jgi:hypothetical protein
MDKNVVQDTPDFASEANGQHLPSFNHAWGMATRAACLLFILYALTL